MEYPPSLLVNVVDHRFLISRIQSEHYGPMAQEFFAAFGHDAVGTIGNADHHCLPATWTEF